MTTEQQHDSKEILNIDFVGVIGIWTTISIGLTILSLILIFTRGLNYGIDFKGGTEIQVRYSHAVTPEEVRAFTETENLKNAVVQQFSSQTTGSEYLIRIESQELATEKETNAALNAMLARVQASIKTKWTDAEIRRVDTVGPQVGNQLKRNGVLAAFYSILCILVYVGLRFDYKFAPGAVVCLAHDAIVTLGVFCVLGKEVNVQIMAAILTIIGYSLNDTIVVYDRIRENFAKFKNRPHGEMINKSINETLNRTILTSLTTFLSVLALYLFAGGVIEEFAFAMMIGIVLGTYSSIYVAAPFILLIDKWRGDTTVAPKRGLVKA